MVAETDKKKMISEMYLELLKVKPGDKITVKMLIDECGLSRQTFYYHFQDIMDVVEYTLKRILDEIVVNCSRIDDSKQAIMLILDTVDQNRGLISKLENTSRSKECERFVADGIHRVMEELLERKPSNIENIKPGDLQFVLSFFSYGILGIVNDHVVRGEKFDTKKMADRLYRLYMGEISILSAE